MPVHPPPENEVPIEAPFKSDAQANIDRNGVQFDEFDASALERSPAARAFVLHWGEMGTRWGINRTVAQVHALLYLSPEPLPADVIAQTLGVARSNVSTSIRELIGWGIVYPVPVLGQRKDHFTAMADVWQMFKLILDERKKRELDPTLAQLQQCLTQARQELSAAADPSRHVPDSQHQAQHTLQRIEAMTDLLTTMSGWYAQFHGLPTGAVRRFMTMGRKAVGMFARLGKRGDEAADMMSETPAGSDSR